VLALGESKYNSHCATCHGNDGRVSSTFPDLRYAAALNNPELFKLIVIDGVLTPNGMVAFSKVLSPQDAEAIRAHVVRLANQAKNAPPGPGRGASGAPPPAPVPPAAPPTPAVHQ
jgi:mono/diheme cytochrome c family protein